MTDVTSMQNPTPVAAAFAPVAAAYALPAGLAFVFCDDDDFWNVFAAVSRIFIPTIT